MPFLDHLEEFRGRLIRSLLAVAVGIGVAFFVLLRFDVLTWAQRPILPYLNGRHLVFTHPGDPFQIIMQGAIGLGLFLALPVVLYQLWAFVSPGLYPHERRIAIGVLAGAVALFVAGASLAYFVVLPLALPWLFSFGVPALEPMITAGDYFGFVFSLVLAFGVAFELPVVLLGLAGLGVVTPQFLSQYRRHAGVAAVVIGAFLTPGDLVWTTIAMAVPLYALYELSIILAHVVYRRRARRDAAAAAADGGAG